MGNKKQLTFYIPEKLFQDSKITAIVNKLSFSDFIANVILIFCDYINDEDNYINNLAERTVNLQDKKPMIYLYPFEKQILKVDSAARNTNLSNFIFQALNYYYSYEHQLQPWIHIYQQVRNDYHSTLEQHISNYSEKTNQSKKEKCCKKVVNLSLTPENAFRLKLLGAYEDTSNSGLISHWVQSADCDLLRNMGGNLPKSMRSSLRLDIDDLKELNKKAVCVNVGLSELINRLIAFHYSNQTI